MTGTKPHAELGSGEKAIEQLALSVVVPVYNGEETLQDCLQAICNQTIPKDRYEVIVVDDGSTDSTPEISRQFPVRLISLEKNHGRIIARQTGAREASSETLVLCDSRVILERDVLETILATPKRPLMFGSDYPELQERTLFGRFYFCLRRQLYKPYYPQEWYGEELEVTEENFSKVPKGMGVFVTERDFFLRHQPQQTDRHTNDDTLMFSSMVRERPIIRYSKMRTRHVGRTRLRDVLGHLNHRGVRFRSYYLTPSHRYFWYYLCGWAAIVSLGVLVAVFPGLGWVVPAVFGGGGWGFR